MAFNALLVFSLIHSWIFDNCFVPLDKQFRHKYYYSVQFVSILNFVVQSDEFNQEAWFHDIFHIISLCFKFIGCPHSYSCSNILYAWKPVFESSCSDLLKISSKSDWNCTCLVDINSDCFIHKFNIKFIILLFWLMCLWTTY